MFGRVRTGFGVPSAVLIDGADGMEKRVALPVCESSSVDDSDELERTEKRGWGCAYAAMESLLKYVLGVLAQFTYCIITYINDLPVQLLARPPADPFESHIIRQLGEHHQVFVPRRSRRLHS